MSSSSTSGRREAWASNPSRAGGPVSAANVLFPRDVGLSIQPGIGGYECMVWGPVAARARLPVQSALLASAVDTARDELMKVVMHRDAAGQYVFQKKIDIPDSDRDAALRIMARAGARLFQQLFFGPAAAEDSKKVGEFLRKMASDRAARLKLQIVAETAPVPWGMLYVGDAVGRRDARLGQLPRHAARHRGDPAAESARVLDSAIRSDNPKLSVSVNVNETIDAQMGADYVAQQKTFWVDAEQSRKRVSVTDRTKSTQVKKALADATTGDQILYFYCHAESTGLNDPGGPDASSLVLTDAAVTLGDLNLDSPTTIQLPGNPLVFINACESGKCPRVLRRLRAVLHGKGRARRRGDRVQDARVVRGRVGQAILRALSRRGDPGRHVPRASARVPRRARQPARPHVRRALRRRYADPARAQRFSAMHLE